MRGRDGACRRTARAIASRNTSAERSNLPVAFASRPRPATGWTSRGPRRRSEAGSAARPDRRRRRSGKCRRRETWPTPGSCRSRARCRPAQRDRTPRPAAARAPSASHLARHLRRAAPALDRRRVRRMSRSCVPVRSARAIALLRVRDPAGLEVRPRQRILGEDVVARRRPPARRSPPPRRSSAVRRPGTAPGSSAPARRCARRPRPARTAARPPSRRAEPRSRSPSRAARSGVGVVAADPRAACARRRDRPLRPSTLAHSRPPRTDGRETPATPRRTPSFASCSWPSCRYSSPTCAASRPAPSRSPAAVASAASFIDSSAPVRSPCSSRAYATRAYAAALGRSAIMRSKASNASVVVAELEMRVADDAVVHRIVRARGRGSSRRRRWRPGTGAATDTARRASGSRRSCRDPAASALRAISFRAIRQTGIAGDARSAASARRPAAPPRATSSPASRSRLRSVSRQFAYATTAATAAMIAPGTRRRAAGQTAEGRRAQRRSRCWPTTTIALDRRDDRARMTVDGRCMQPAHDLPHRAGFGLSFQGLPPECGSARYGKVVRNGTSLPIDAVAETRLPADRATPTAACSVMSITSSVSRRPFGKPCDVAAEHAQAGRARRRQDVGVQPQHLGRAHARRLIQARHAGQEHLHEIVARRRRRRDAVDQPAGASALPDRVTYCRNCAVVAGALPFHLSFCADRNHDLVDERHAEARHLHEGAGARFRCRPARVVVAGRLAVAHTPMIGLDAERSDDFGTCSAMLWTLKPARLSTPASDRFAP